MSEIVIPVRLILLPSTVVVRYLFEGKVKHKNFYDFIKAAEGYTLANADNFTQKFFGCRFSEISPINCSMFPTTNQAILTCVPLFSRAFNTHSTSGDFRMLVALLSENANNIPGHELLSSFTQISKNRFVYYNIYTRAWSNSECVLTTESLAITTWESLSASNPGSGTEVNSSIPVKQPTVSNRFTQVIPNDANAIDAVNQHKVCLVRVIMTYPFAHMRICTPVGSQTVPLSSASLIRCSFVNNDTDTRNLILRAGFHGAFVTPEIKSFEIFSPQFWGGSPPCVFMVPPIYFPFPFLIFSKSFLNTISNYLKSPVSVYMKSVLNFNGRHHVYSDLCDTALDGPLRHGVIFNEEIEPESDSKKTIEYTNDVTGVKVAKHIVIPNIWEGMTVVSGLGGAITVALTYGKMSTSSLSL